MSGDAVLLLAAGRGRRLSPMTDELPKCLLPVSGTTPLELMLGQLSARSVGELVIVVGHARDRIASYLRSKSLPWPVREIFNPRFDTANNIVSVHLAREHCRNGFLLVNSDVICHPTILETALAAPAGDFLMIDPQRPPRPEAMKVRYAGGRLSEISKDLDAAEADGEYIGLARFTTSGARRLFDAVEGILARGGESEWYEAAIGEAARATDIRGRSTEGLPWIEIDDPDDLDRAGREILPRLGPISPPGENN